MKSHEKSRNPMHYLHESTHTHAQDIRVTCRCIYEHHVGLFGRQTVHRKDVPTQRAQTRLQPFHADAHCNIAACRHPWTPTPHRPAAAVKYDTHRVVRDPSPWRTRAGIFVSSLPSRFLFDLPGEQNQYLRSEEG